jgi:hypothetical protein
VTNRIRELGDREAELQLRCAVQRRELAKDVSIVERRLSSVDRVARVTRSVVLNPVVAIAGIVGLILLGRSGGYKLFSRGILLAAAARRGYHLARLAGSFLQRTPPAPPP